MVKNETPEAREIRMQRSRDYQKKTYYEKKKNRGNNSLHFDDFIADLQTISRSIIILCNKHRYSYFSANRTCDMKICGEICTNYADAKAKIIDFLRIPPCRNVRFSICEVKTQQYKAISSHSAVKQQQRREELQIIEVC
jgi:hypothetical protein